MLALPVGPSQPTAPRTIHIYAPLIRFHLLLYEGETSPAFVLARVVAAFAVPFLSGWLVSTATAGRTVSFFPIPSALWHASSSLLKPLEICSVWSDNREVLQCGTFS